MGKKRRYGGEKTLWGEDIMRGKYVMEEKRHWVKRCCMGGKDVTGKKKNVMGRKDSMGKDVLYGG